MFAGVTTKAKAVWTDLTSTNTYARRVTKHHSYDYENMMVNVDIAKSLKKTELANVDHSYNQALENVLTNVHSISDKFMLVNVSIPSLPIVYVSNEFTSFYRYERNDVFLADARLKFMMGPKTRNAMLREIKHTMEASQENTLDHVLYTKDGIPVDTTIGLLRFQSADSHSKDSYFAMTFNPFKSKASREVGEKDPEKELNVELGERTLIAPILKQKNAILQNEAQNKKRLLAMMSKLFSGSRLLEDSTFRKTWDWFMLIVVVWATFSVPLQACFDQMLLYYKNVDILTDIVLLIDIFLNFRTTFVNADGLVISDSKKMAAHYIKGWFFVDVITGLPWQIIQLFFPDKASQAAKFLRIIKVLRVLRIIKVGKKLDDYTKNGPLSLVLIIMFFIILGHFFACCWFLLGKLHYEDGVAGWIAYHLQDNRYSLDSNLINDKDLQHDFYSASLYFIMTIFCTVGFGNITPWNVWEQVFCIIAMLIGAFFYAIIFGSATNIIMRMGAQQSRFLDQQKDLQMYTDVNQFPLDLRNRMEDYFYYHWYNSKGIEHSKMMESWPRTLKEDTSLFLHRILFAEWPVFNEASTGCRRALSSRVERHGFTPGDYIVHVEDCVDCVYFVVRGHVKILRDGDVIGILTKGDTFGEKWWPSASSGKSNADIQAMTYAEIEVLDHTNLREILVKFPDYWQMWHKKLEITYELTKREGDIFENLPDDLKIFVTNERTAAYEEEKEDEMDDMALLRNAQSKLDSLKKILEANE